mgnify:CR=1 FL=1
MSRDDEALKIVRWLDDEILREVSRKFVGSVLEKISEGVNRAFEENSSLPEKTLSIEDFKKRKIAIDFDIAREKALSAAQKNIDWLLK